MNLLKENDNFIFINMIKNNNKDNKPINIRN